MAEKLVAISDRLFRDFMAPLVLGGEMRPARPIGGKNAKWDKTISHRANSGNLGYCDGGVQQVNDASIVGIVRGIKSTETVDGTLRFYLP